MSWVCELTPDAEKNLRDLPADARRRIARALDQMAVDPFQANTTALRGEWRGVFRIRVGPYPILFTADYQNKSVTVVRVVRRSESTYR
jgi:mRNA-degrading endonuclease RelE of RelBE toxin-antitoxin system